MAASTGKTIGLIALVVIIAAVALRMTPFFFAPFGFMMGTVRGIKDFTIDGIHILPRTFAWTSLSLVTLALFVIWIMVIVWVYRDAERRGMNGVLWALLVFVGNLIGLIIYLIVRNEAVRAPGPSTAVCPSCQKSVESGFAYCPHCGKPMRLVCAQCGKPMEKEWKTCPHCGEKIK